MGISLEELIRREEEIGNYGYNYPENDITLKNVKKSKKIDKENKITNNIKPFKEKNIMKARSDIKKSGDKFLVDTNMKVKKSLEPKVKNALKKSINLALDKEFKGGSINLDYGSSDESSDGEKSKIDKNELKNYASMLRHLLEHIEDDSEPIDKKDYKDAKKLIDNMEKVKKGKGLSMSKNKVAPDNVTIDNNPLNVERLRGLTRTEQRRLIDEQLNKLNRGEIDDIIYTGEKVKRGRGTSSSIVPEGEPSNLEREKQSQRNQGRVYQNDTEYESLVNKRKLRKKIEDKEVKRQNLKYRKRFMPDDLTFMERYFS